MCRDQPLVTACLLIDCKGRPCVAIYQNEICGNPYLNIGAALAEIALWICMKPPVASSLAAL